MRLKDKVVLITGSTMGIGKAIAKKCVEEGARVVIHGLERKEGEKVANELGEGNAVFLKEDLLDMSSAKRLTEKTLLYYEKLDVIINNAAIVAASNTETTDVEFLDDVFRVNTYSPFLLIKEGLAALSKNHGCVLNIGSINAWAGEPNLLAYSMSKGALMTMTRNLGDVLFRDHGVRVNQINPGWVLTEKEIERKRSHGLSNDWYKDIPAMYAPSGRIILPEEIANAVIYWISDESGPISAQVVDLEQFPLIGRNAPKDTSTIN